MSLTTIGRMRWSRGVWPRDFLIGVVVTVVAQVELLLLTTGSAFPTGWFLANLVILPAFAVRRTYPLASAVIAAVGFAIPMAGHETLGVATPFLALLFLLASLGWYASLTAGLMGTAVVLAGGLVPQFVTQTTSAADALVNTVVIVGTWAAGHLVRHASDRRVAAEVSADRVAREAVDAERSRIARDLHDSMGHALTLIALQSGSARERAADERTRDLLQGIETTSRSAMTDLHRLLELGGREQALGAESLGDLVDAVRRSVLGIDLHVDLPDLGGGAASGTVYRVVQEGLTNVVRHSDARRARVEVGHDGDGSAVVRITDDGRPRSPKVNGAGVGLSGLRERVALAGGTLEVKADPGGWRLEARIPWDPS